MQHSHRQRHRLFWLLIAPLLVLVIIASMKARREFPAEPELPEQQP